MFFHPLSAPRTRFKPRADAEPGASHFGEATAEGFPTHQRRLVRTLAVHDQLKTRKQGRLVSAQWRPIDEVKPFVHLFGGLRLLSAQIGNATGPRTELDFVL